MYEVEKKETKYKERRREELWREGSKLWKERRNADGKKDLKKEKEKLSSPYVWSLLLASLLITGYVAGVVEHVSWRGNQ